MRKKKELDWYETVTEFIFGHEPTLYEKVKDMEKILRRATRDVQNEINRRTFARKEVSAMLRQKCGNHAEERELKTLAMRYATHGRCITKLEATVDKMDDFKMKLNDVLTASITNDVFKDLTHCMTEINKCTGNAFGIMNAIKRYELEKDRMDLIQEEIDENLVDEDDAEANENDAKVVLEKVLAELHIETDSAVSRFLFIVIIIIITLLDACGTNLDTTACRQHTYNCEYETGRAYH